ncbi:hypothetical protein TIFTF001_031129 [Ficus carica]|uniref:Uncharacterized protein n=1 Tax=Ficus carica TaxID=3494 RepID=A0AA88DUX8_FICCA|nr:hypothetical protein TIFTF001_031129 [Ficus carica]
MSLSWKFEDNFSHSWSTSRTPRTLLAVGSILAAAQIASVRHSSSQAHHSGLLNSAGFNVMRPSSPSASASSSKSQIAMHPLLRPQPSPSSPPVSVGPLGLLPSLATAVAKVQKKKGSFEVGGLKVIKGSIRLCT